MTVIVVYLHRSECKTSGRYCATCAASGLEEMGSLHAMMRESLWLPKCGMHSEVPGIPSNQGPGSKGPG